MEHEGKEGKIIVFRDFDNSIDANIVKTKLDAYGIPCFLTEENLANLYPGQHFAYFRVRLHLFEQDVALAQQIMEEQALALTEDTTVCPRCKSTTLERDFSKKLSKSLLGELNILFFGIFFSQKKVYRCRQCQYEFL